MNYSVIDEDIKGLLQADIDYKRFYNKTVLISGANGYVPSYFVHFFMKLNDECGAGIKLLALCRNVAKARERFSRYLNRENFVLLIQDVCNPIAYEGDIHFFIHAASPAGIGARYDDPVNTFEANVIGIKNMLSLASKNPCEGFLFLSSVDVYGKMEDGHRLVEGDQGYLDMLDSRNVYSCAKCAAETLCLAYNTRHNLPVHIVRPFQIIGPGPELNDGRLHIDFVSQILGQRKIVLKSDGSAIRSFMYITDAISAMLLVLLNGAVGEAYNVVTESGEASVLELAEIMARNSKYDVDIEFDMTTRQNVEVVKALSVVTGDSTKLSGLGWKPRVTLEEACKRMLEYYGV